MNQVHRGNVMDIYVHDPDNILTGTASVVMSSNTLNTATIPGISNYIQEILEVREGISKVPFDTTAYIITNLDTGSSYSSSANYKIAFDQDSMAGALIEIVYRY